MNSVVCEGKTIEEAVERALLLLDVPSEEAEVVVLQEPKSRLLGMSQTAARVRVTLKVVPGMESQSPPQAAPLPSRSEPDSVSRETELGMEKSQALEAGRPEGGSGSQRSGESPSDSEPHSESHDEEVGEQAADALQELLDLMNLECDVAASWDEDEERFVIEVSGPDTGIVIGRQGQTLDAVELVLNRMLEKRNPNVRRVLVDAEGYRGRREEKLRDLAIEQASRVRQTRQPVPLEPMSPRDRRTVHMAIKELSGVTTYSEGEGRDRHVVIEPVRSA